jgi:hypothetical protein
MRKLESTIAQFVEDLLHTIGEATVDELRELFAGRPEGERPIEVPIDLSGLELSVASKQPAQPPHAIRAEPRVHAARPAGRRRAFGSIPSATPYSSGSFSPPGVAEITDPESLLSLGGAGEVSRLNGARFSHLSHRPDSSGSAAADGESATLAEPQRAPSRARARALLDVSERSTLGDVRGHVRAHDRADGHAEGHAERRANGHAEPDGESPASSVRPVGSATVKLSDNETFARVSNSGVVIRRKKKAQG